MSSKIVKVQLSQYTTDNKQRMLIYDEKRIWQLECQAPEKIIKILNGRPKAYFNAQLIRGELVLEGEVSTQNW